MKFHLSSYRIPNAGELFALTGAEPAQNKVAIIPNAGDYYAPRAKRFKYNKTVQLFAELGAPAEVIDLQDYESGEQLRKKLGEFTLLWVSGGNTFCLIHEMRRSGFDTVIGDLMQNGLVYAGESAGAVAAGTSLRGTELADEPEFAESISYNGLGLIPYCIVPHTDNPNFFEANEATRQMHAGQPMLELTDNQAALFENDNQTYRIVERELPLEQ